MNILLTILLVIAAILVLFVIVALLTRKNYNVERSAIINAPLPIVFAYIRLLKNQDDYNKWVMTDPAMKRNFTGTDGTVGFIYAWNGNKKAGEGAQEIKALTENQSIETEVRFVRPFPGVAKAIMTTATVSDHQTKITWSNASQLKFPMNALIVMIEKMLAKDMDTSLSNLKTILEK